MTTNWAVGLETKRYTEVGTVSGTLIQGIATCDYCKRASLGVSDSPASGSSNVDRFERASDASFVWYPRTGESKEFPDVPDAIAAAAKEAHSASSINAPMAAILMARTVVEATAKDKGIKTGNLVAKIDAMASAGLIRPATKDAAHEIRHFGNDMAHGDIEDVPTVEDSSEVLELMDEVLNEVFQGPARTARIKEKRTGNGATVPGMPV
ncbi:DUF4145 domain-containing protein [Cryobacterium sp. TMT3-29-2]|uniref:DUF4145 domain-containing protein n=1 Tax=Cryobacterium sp. TMT3-29-2 TaxID=2555867 RepID=UPI00142F422F|nr:DUF4145 domain-containing protein [Cryobacterium sp. TMT3-29-2]